MVRKKTGGKVTNVIFSSRSMNLQLTFAVLLGVFNVVFRTTPYHFRSTQLAEDLSNPKGSSVPVKSSNETTTTKSNLNLKERKKKDWIYKSHLIQYRKQKKASSDIYTSLTLRCTQSSILRVEMILSDCKLHQPLFFICANPIWLLVTSVAK